jgi:hypothetical protein
LEPSQIFVSSIEHDATASFQVMPYFIEDADDFQKKMDQIDSDVCEDKTKICLFIFGFLVKFT